MTMNRDEQRLGAEKSRFAKFTNIWTCTFGLIYFFCFLILLFRFHYLLAIFIKPFLPAWLGIAFALFYFLSFPVSIYLMASRYSRKDYEEAFRYSFLPIIVLIVLGVVMNYIMKAHGY